MAPQQIFLKNVG